MTTPDAKLQILAWAEPDVAHSRFAAAVRSSLTDATSTPDLHQLTLHVTEDPPPRWALVPFRDRPVALVSVTGDAAADPSPWLDRLAPLGGDRAAFRVTESVPVPCARFWPQGAATPGAGLLALLRRHPDLPYDRFLQEWHGHHTPMSLDIHPLKHYVRNVVQERLTPTAPLLDGIVTEHFDPPADLLNPLRLFGGPVRMLPGMVRVGLHIRTFLDLRGLENYLVTEYRLRDP